MIPVPWDATTSFRDGTREAPSAILRSSQQVDLFDFFTMSEPDQGIYMGKIDHQLSRLNERTRALFHQKNVMQVDANCAWMNEWVENATKKAMGDKKLPFILGGDHSVSFGAIKALAEKYGELGIVHFDAHADLRKAYNGCTYSHASVMYNVLDKIDADVRIIQQGIRDICQEEMDIITADDDRITNISFRTSDIDINSYAKLPKQIYVSVDIDCLDVQYCPNTGTPVPGGLHFNSLVDRMAALEYFDKQIVGMDLVEVGREELDSIVGAQLMYKMICFMLQQNTCAPVYR